MLTWIIIYIILCFCRVICYINDHDLIIYWEFLGSWSFVSILRWFYNPSVIAFHKLSDGTGAMISIASFDTGWINEALWACKLIPPSGLERSKRYLRSPLIGHPILASWHRIWWWRPVLNQFQEIVFIGMCQQSIVQNRFLGVRTLRVISITFVLLLVSTSQFTSSSSSLGGRFFTIAQ